MAEQNKRKSENKNSQVKYSLHESRNVKTGAKRSAHSCLRGRILNNKKMVRDQDRRLLYDET